MKQEDRDITRTYPGSPLVGVGGLIFRKDTILLGLRGKEPARGKWSIPGGAVKLGESLEDAVKREISEEVNLKISVKEVVAVLDRIIKDEHGRVKYHYVLVDFLCEQVEAEENPIPGTDLTDCRYVPLSNLKDYNLTPGSQEIILRAYESIRFKGYHPFQIYDPHI